MLKSPSSILNSIQRMKNNLRNDKQQLRIIKTNFVYLDHIQPRSRPFDHQTKIKNRSNSLLNSNPTHSSNSQQSLHDKQNHNIRANLVPDNCHSQISIKDQPSTQRESIIKKNIIYLQKQQHLGEPQNILKDQSNFKKNESSRISHHDEKARQLSQIKNIKARYQGEVQRLKEVHEDEKRQLVDKIITSANQERESYERQIKQMREYIELLQNQLQESTQNKRNDLVNKSCQVIQNLQTPKEQCQTVQQQTQTVDLHPINHFSSISSSHNNNFSSQLQISNPTNSSINSENSPNTLVNGVCVHQNNLIEQLCFKYFGNAGNDYMLEKPIYDSNSKSQSFHVTQRQKYEHIINKLLEENTKLYNKIEKIYGQAHSSENFHQQKNKNTFFKSFGINYKTVTSHGVQQSRDHSSVTDRSMVINKYPSSKENPSNPVQSVDSGSQFASRVAESQNYHSHREASLQFKGKQSIIYRISNVMSASVMKEGKNSSRSKIPSKNPPVKVKQGINVSMPHQRRMKTEVTQKSSQFYSQNFNSNHPISNFETIGDESHMISSEQRIPTMREKTKKQPSFKFYDQESQSCQVPNKAGDKGSWQDQSEGQIGQDQIKLKTIKNFKCMQNQ